MNETYTAFFDACTLFGAQRRDLLMQLSLTGLFRPRWSPDIMAELRRSLSHVTRTLLHRVSTF